MKLLDQYCYINSDSKEIVEYTKKMARDGTDLESVVRNILNWFDEHMSYSRLNSPYYPLQRSDLDTLRMRSGTCGDYSNLIVSSLLTLGIPAKYAVIKKDCYGHEQSHICVVAKSEEEWVLIDATLPYRKWWGYKTPHQDYDIYSPEEFEKKCKEEEKYCYKLALEWGNKDYAGLLYGPWLYEELVINEADFLDSIFYLLVFNSPKEWNLYVYYLHYSAKEAKSSLMATLNPKKTSYRFSVNEVDSIWDENQWSIEYEFDSIPEKYKSENFYTLRENMEKMVGRIEKIIPL